MANSNRKEFETLAKKLRSKEREREEVWYLKKGGCIYCNYYNICSQISKAAVDSQRLLLMFIQSFLSFDAIIALLIGKLAPVSGTRDSEKQAQVNRPTKARHVVVLFRSAANPKDDPYLRHCG